MYVTDIINHYIPPLLCYAVSVLINFNNQCLPIKYLLIVYVCPNVFEIILSETPKYKNIFEICLHSVFWLLF